MKISLYTSVYYSLLLLTSCSISHDEENTHPYWQNNYYKYKTNKPDLPADKIFRLGYSQTDTSLEIDKLQNVEVINANSTSLEHVPEEIKNMKSLRSLNLTWTNLNYFPMVVFEMPQLISLDFAFRENIVAIDTLAHNFKLLKNLELLSLISCRLNDIPEPITELVKLKYLSLEQNQIVNLSNNIERLDSLINLDLSQNKIQSLPNGFSKLILLEKLNLYENNLKSFPLAICELSNLRELDLRYNDIKDLPEEVLKLKKIKNLDLSNNPNFKLTKELALKLKTELKSLERIYLVDTNHNEREVKELSQILNGKVIFFMKD